MNNLPPKFQNRSLEDLKSSHRAIQNKLDSLREEAAIITGVLPLKPGRKFWVADEIDWDDPKLEGIKDTYFELKDTSSSLAYHVGRLEAIKNDELPLWEAKVKAITFLEDNFNGIEEEAEFFRKNNLVRGYSSLKWNLLRNPNFLEGVVL